jgi:hypothetical protein
LYVTFHGSWWVLYPTNKCVLQQKNTNPHRKGSSTSWWLSSEPCWLQEWSAPPASQ